MAEVSKQRVDVELRHVVLDAEGRVPPVLMVKQNATTIEEIQLQVDTATQECFGRIIRHRQEVLVDR